MKQKIKNAKVASTDAADPLYWKAGLMPTLWGLAMLGVSPQLMAANECGVGPTVTCTATNYAASGITYDFSSDLDIVIHAVSGSGASSNQNIGANGVRLNGSGDADLRFRAGFGSSTLGVLGGAGGVQISMDTGNVYAEFHHNVTNTVSINDANIGTGVHVSTDGSAELRLFGSRNPGSTPFRMSNLVMDVGGDSRVWVDYRRAVLLSDLSPRAGGKLTIDNDGGIFGNERIDFVNSIISVTGSGAGHLVINNALARGRIGGRMDFTGMTGKLTILNDYSGSSRQGGWHTMGGNLFGSGEVEIQNRRYGVLRTVTQTILDFSSASDARFFNAGRVMVGAKDLNTSQIADHHLSFIGLDLFENSGVILMGATFDVLEDKGDISNGIARDRLSFQDSHYVGVEGGRIALDALLGRTARSDCTPPLAVADCVQFTGSSTTAGMTFLTIRDIAPALSAAGFNPGIVLIEGASAAEHFVLDPANLYYVGDTSGGAALQKGMIAYRLEYDAGTRQHSLVGTLADEGVQASTLGAAAHEVWRASADTWFDRQASTREGAEGFVPQGLWAAVNTSRGDRSLNRVVDVGGNPSRFNLNQDQDITHFAFGLDLLSGRSGDHSWGGGVTAGLLNSTVDYEATRTQTTMRGMSAGLYADWSWGDLSVDALFNTNYLRQSIEGGNFGLGQHNRLRSQVKSNGGRVEAAWKLPMSEAFWLQPLVGVSHVRTSEGDITLPDDAGGVRFGNDDRSWRVGAGLRMGLDSQLAGLRAQYRLTGRMWNEREAQNTILIDSTEAPIGVRDDFSGNFNELDGSLSLSSEGGSLSGYIGVKHKFSDDYSSFGGSAGVRYSW